MLYWDMMSYVMHQITQQIDFYKSPQSMKCVTQHFQLLSCLIFLFPVHNDIKIYLARSSTRTSVSTTTATTNKRDTMEHFYILFRGYKNVLFTVIFFFTWLVNTFYIKIQFHRQKETFFNKFTTFQKVIQKQFGSSILVDIKVLSAFLWAKVMHFTTLAYFWTPSSVPKCSYNVS